MVMDLMEGKSLHEEMNKNPNGYTEDEAKSMISVNIH